ncbi:hypothetical protein EYF80_032242 [Liparis tanakae]|uniref:Uncharacterized protein n=1 Tax=Liparis tanakae TaxID=230148 RepID=A0A4Z2GVD1_9TELE|nr:hypothetical protein EYF80_032242 [Liparis tanakae]
MIFKKVSLPPPSGQEVSLHRLCFPHLAGVRVERDKLIGVLDPDRGSRLLRLHPLEKEGRRTQLLGELSQRVFSLCCRCCRNLKGSRVAQVSWSSSNMNAVTVAGISTSLLCLGFSRMMGCLYV